jgi:hypothetical protein
MKKAATVVIATAMLVLTAPSASAAPNPSPVAPTHTGTACASVLTNNPNTGPGGHISAQGAAHFGAVGAVMCGL